MEPSSRAAGMDGAVNCCWMRLFLTAFGAAEHEAGDDELENVVKLLVGKLMPGLVAVAEGLRLTLEFTVLPAPVESDTPADRAGGNGEVDDSGAAGHELSVIDCV